MDGLKGKDHFCQDSMCPRAWRRRGDDGPRLPGALISPGGAVVAPALTVMAIILIFGGLAPHLDHVVDLRFWLELKEFEPLTPSMRSELIAIADRQVLVKSQVRALLLNGWERFGSVHIRDDLPNSSQLIKEENGA
jgi:hypothetical protein